jgi:hypothetical protein
MDDTKINALMQYLARGWALVPLHDVGGVAGGPCSCGAGPSCKSAGKHPRVWGEDSPWQRPENLVTTVERLHVALQRWPASNWGLATGLVSGVWALDYDPKAVVDPQAAGVVLAMLAGVPTWQQRTGSGGAHWLFSLPPDFIPNNSSKRLPAGFDVRGARSGEVSGGQIVLAPSVSGVGPYEVLIGGDVLAAPAALLDLVRPAPPRERPAGSVPFVLTAATAGQAAAYVVAAVNGELRKMIDTPVGGRNQAAMATARRIIELINTGLIDRQGAFDAWWAAVSTHPDGITFGRKLMDLWARQERHVGDRPADLSGVGGPSGWGGDRIPFSAAPGAAPGLGQAGSGNGAPGVTGTRDSVTSGVTSQVTGVTDPYVDPVDAMTAELLSVDQLKTMPPPQPLINGLLDLDTTAWLIGASGSYKSFVALDLAAHVGRGDDWRGRATRQGEVIYVVAEGARGMKLRVEAWEREYGPMKDVAFLPRPVQANGEGWAVLVEVCRRRRPALVVIDTQARVTIGLDENSNSDMSLYAERVDQIKRATGACVLTVHHLGRNGTNARGASAIDGAQDAELRIERKGAYSVELHMDKQKDQAEEGPVRIRLRRSEGGADPETGRDLSSLVLDHATDGLGEAQGPAVDVGKARATLLFQTIAREHPHGEGGTRAELRQMFFDLPEIAALAPDLRRQAWRRAWAFLVSRGRVMRYGSSERFRVFPPPDGSTDGVLTMNTGGADDMPPDGWNTHWPEDDRAAADRKADVPSSGQPT